MPLSYVLLGVLSVLPDIDTLAMGTLGPHVQIFHDHLGFLSLLTLWTLVFLRKCTDL